MMAHGCTQCGQPLPVSGGVPFGGGAVHSHCAELWLLCSTPVRGQLSPVLGPTHWTSTVAPGAGAAQHLTWLESLCTATPKLLTATAVATTKGLSMTPR